MVVAAAAMRSNINPLLLSPVVSRLLDHVSLFKPTGAWNTELTFLKARLVCKLWCMVADGKQPQWIMLMWRAGFPTTTEDGKVYLKLQKTVPLRVQLAKHNGKKLRKKLLREMHGWEQHLVAVRAQEEDAIKTIKDYNCKVAQCDKALAQLEKTPRKRFVLVNSKLTFKKRNNKHGK